MMDRLAEVAREAERKLGLPPLSKLADSLDKLPDERRLKLIKDVLTLAERVSHSAPELDQVISLIREINSLPTEKLDKLLQILRKVEKIIKTTPQDLLGFISSLKEE
ncbi:hypothetical protein ES703_38763 [subsurface metagenome]